MYLFMYILKQCISNVAALILGNILFHILYYYNIPFIIIIIIIIIIIMLQEMEVSRIAKFALANEDTVDSLSRKVQQVLEKYKGHSFLAL